MVSLPVPPSATPDPRLRERHRALDVGADYLSALCDPKASPAARRLCDGRPQVRARCIGTPLTCGRQQPGAGSPNVTRATRNCGCQGSLPSLVTRRELRRTVRQVSHFLLALTGEMTGEREARSMCLAASLLANIQTDLVPHENQPRVLSLERGCRVVDQRSKALKDLRRQLVSYERRCVLRPLNALDHRKTAAEIARTASPHFVGDLKQLRAARRADPPHGFAVQVRVLEPWRQRIDLTGPYFSDSSVATLAPTPLIKRLDACQ
jgi:hypothetical protein